MLGFLIGNKFKILGALAAVGVLISVGIAIDRIAYNKGLNVSALEIAKYQTAILSLDGKLKEAQSKVNTRIEYKYLTDTVERTRIQYVNRDVIIDRVPEQYALSVGWVYAHNQAALGLEINPMLASDAAPSIITDRIAIEKISSNYIAVCQANEEKLTALQTWVRETKEAADEVNSTTR
jgi:hypothetical protein